MIVKELEMPVAGVACVVHYTIDHYTDEIEIISVSEFDTGEEVSLTDGLESDVLESIQFHNEYLNREEEFYE